MCRTGGDEFELSLKWLLENYTEMALKQLSVLEFRKA